MLFSHGAEATPRQNLSIDRIFVGIEVDRVPYIFVNGTFAIVTFWEGPRGLTGSYIIRHQSPSGASGRLTGNLVFGVNSKGHSIILVEKMVFDSYGDHRFDVIVGEKVFLSETLAVVPEIEVLW
jgi:hypothetical protein